MVIQLTVPHDWAQRLATAELLQTQNLECSMCGGTGGWPGLGQFVSCRPCMGKGLKG